MIIMIPQCHQTPTSPAWDVPVTLLSEPAASWLPSSWRFWPWPPSPLSPCSPASWAPSLEGFMSGFAGSAALWAVWAELPCSSCAVSMAFDKQRNCDEMIKPFAGWSGWHCLTWKSACKKKKLANSKDFKASNRIRWIHGLNNEKSPISCFASWTACVLHFKSEESQPQQVYAECHGSRQLVMNQIMNFIEWLKAAATPSRTSHQKTCQTMCTAVLSTFHCQSPAKGVTTWFRSDAPSLHQSVALPVATRAKPISYSSLHLSIYKNSSIIQWQLRLNAITMCYKFRCLSICDIRSTHSFDMGFQSLVNSTVASEHYIAALFSVWSTMSFAMCSKSWTIG